MLEAQEYTNYRFAKFKGSDWGIDIEGDGVKGQPINVFGYEKHD